MRLGHAQYRACSGMPTGRCYCICTDSETKAFEGWLGVKNGSKGATSFHTDILQIVEECSAEDLGYFVWWSPVKSVWDKERWALPWILRPFSCGITSHPGEWICSRFCLRTLLCHVMEMPQSKSDNKVA